MNRLRTLLQSICIPQLLMIVIVVVLGLSSMLSGCGKKGPLYIPEKQKQSFFQFEPGVSTNDPTRARQKFC